MIRIEQNGEIDPSAIVNIGAIVPPERLQENRTWAEASSWRFRLDYRSGNNEVLSFDSAASAQRARDLLVESLMIAAVPGQRVNPTVSTEPPARRLARITREQSVAIEAALRTLESVLSRPRRPESIDHQSLNEGFSALRRIGEAVRAAEQETP